MNHFLKKFETKSSNELKQILKSNKYVEKAKEAARELLSQRGVEHIDYNKSKPKIKSRVKSTATKTTKRNFEGLLFIVGLPLLIVGSYMISPTLLITENDLINITGNIDKCEVNYKTVYSYNRVGTESENIRATINFNTMSSLKRFELRKDIKQRKYDSYFEKLRLKILNSNDLDIWVRKSKIDNLNLEVYRLDIDKTTVISLNSVKKEKTQGFSYFVILGLAITIASLIITLLKKKKP